MTNMLLHQRKPAAMADSGNAVITPSLSYSLSRCCCSLTTYCRLVLAGQGSPDNAGRCWQGSDEERKGFHEHDQYSQGFIARGQEPRSTTRSAKGCWLGKPNASVKFRNVSRDMPPRNASYPRRAAIIDKL